ncbi:colicin M immunity protein [Escherichia coli]|uniref:colicin M immunity protein n=1 Tax=Escherichia coli TaxID=562 RepID=UPI00092D6B99|nr:colicin M immunity protein [Escherichia coli]EEZ7649734.1 colicin M immunity protein [Escherichia coli]
MKVISMKFIFILTIIALAAVFFWSEDKSPACYQVSDEQARTFVKNDYLQRMKRWDNDVQLLGTEIPKITWEKIERSLTDVEDEKTLLVPFKAEGPEGKRMYYGMYHCEEGYVEYAND